MNGNIPNMFDCRANSVVHLSAHIVTEYLHHNLYPHLIKIPISIPMFSHTYV